MGDSPKTRGLKKQLNLLSGHLANISLSIEKGGHLNPKNDIAGNIKEFKGTFDSFVSLFSAMARNNKSVLTSMAIEEFLRHLTHFS